MKISWMLILLLLLSSCNFLLGIKQPKSYTQSKIESTTASFIVKDAVYRIDTAIFFNTYQDLKTSNALAYKNILQPMQLMVFDKNKNLITHLINCNIGGIPLKWNRTQSFDHYPIEARGITEPTYKVQFNDIQQYFVPQLTEEAWQNIFQTHEYVYVVYYTYAFKGVTKSLFKNLRQHQTTFADKKIKYIYVFMEDLYLHPNLKQ
jgi:hypothetical protein